jgi:hypothetical protein
MNHVEQKQRLDSHDPRDEEAIAKNGYSKDGEALTLEPVEGTYRYEWFGPARGETAASGQIRAAGGKQEFKTHFCGDAVLYLHRAKEQG